MALINPFMCNVCLFLKNTQVFILRCLVYWNDLVMATAEATRDWFNQIRPFLLLPVANVQAPAYWARRARYEAHLATVTPHKHGPTWLN